MKERYSNMTPDQRQVYNSKRREQYHRQTENSRHRRRERERLRYHSMPKDMAKNRNERRAKLERERYQKLAPDELDSKNRRRRERAASTRLKKEQEKHHERLQEAEVLANTADMVNIHHVAQQLPLVDGTTALPIHVQPNEMVQAITPIKAVDQAVSVDPTPVLEDDAALIEQVVDNTVNSIV